MPRKKAIEVNEASIVDLKAELFRKEEQFKKEKGKNEVPSKPAVKKPLPWAKMKKEPKMISPPNLDTYSREEDKALEKSRRVLEAKAALYDKMATGEVEDEDAVKEDGGRFLVDFHKKVYSQEQDRSDEITDNEIPEPNDPSEEWVDYVDHFGRERRCLRKDLPSLKAMDKAVSPENSSPPSLLSDDMRREILRQKWEKEEEENLNKPIGDIHYQDVQFDELRSHGVGYYQFSRDKEQRQEQMSLLNQYREQTIDARVRREKLKEKRKAALDVRLAKIRERKNRKMNGNEVNPEDVENNEESENEEVKQRENEPPTLSEIQERVQCEAERIKHAKTRESNLAGNWKRHQMIEHERETLKTQQRKNVSEDRDEEFAPPSFYYDESTSNKNRQNLQVEPRHDTVCDDNEELGPSDQNCENFRNEFESHASQSKSQLSTGHKLGKSMYITHSLPPPPKEGLATSFPNQVPWQSQDNPPVSMPWPSYPYQYTSPPGEVYSTQVGSTNARGGSGQPGMYGQYPHPEQIWGYPGYDTRMWPPQGQIAHTHPFQPESSSPNGDNPSQGSHNPLSKLISFCQQNEPGL